MEPSLTVIAEMRVIGLALRTSNAKEGNPATAQIGGLWRKFLEESLIEKIPNRKDEGVILGVYTNYESDHTGLYSLVVSAEVTRLDSIPAGHDSGRPIPGVPGSWTHPGRRHRDLAEDLELLP